ncbi:MAG TPA: GNAT family N-acetyltransferase [Candidatus Dormibacteraeota bacterium]|jgi:GNAT superfamily N-acetyltransferase
MVSVEPHRDLHLEQLQRLVNCHLAGVVPGWQLPRGIIAGSLRPMNADPELDLWVAERHTLCAVEEGRLLGAAHVLRYTSRAGVGAGYRGAAELAWLLFWPQADTAAQVLVDSARELVAGWGATRLYACDTSLPVPVVSGVPESWPHVSAALTRAGFEPMVSDEHVLYGGRLPEVDATRCPPVPGLEVRSASDEPGQRFLAEFRGTEIGFLEWSPDLSCGGSLPALSGWAELCALRIREDWRGRGVGEWLVRRTVPFLRMVGVSRVVVALAARQEEAGAGRFCRRLGWEPVVRLEQGWSAGP